MPLTAYIESGLKIELDSAISFRLADTKFYRARSGLHLKEMDFGWWDNETRTLWLLEVKGEETWESDSHEQLIPTLQKKIVDSLLMLTAMWSGRSPGSELSLELPEPVRISSQVDQIRLVVVIPTPAKRKPLLSAVGTKLNQLVCGEIGLFGIRRVSVLDAGSAITRGLPVTVAT